MATAIEIFRSEASRLHRLVLTGAYKEEVTSMFLKMAVRYEIAALLMECSDSAAVESEIDVQLLQIH